MGELVLFDLDNTLVDRTGAFQEWAQHFCTERALDAEAEAWIVVADGDGFTPRRQLFERLRERYGLKDDVDELLEVYYERYFACFRPDPAVISALQALRDHSWRIGVVTNGGKWQATKLERAQLSGFVDVLCVSEEVGWAKPDRRMFVEAAKRCGL